MVDAARTHNLPTLLLHSGTERPRSAEGSMSGFFHVNISEEGLGSSRGTFQHLYGMSNKQSCRPEPLWSMCWQYYLMFVDDAVIFAEVLRFP